MTLALSSSSPLVSVALVDRDGVVSSLSRMAPQSASAAVAELVQQAMQEAGRSLADVDQIAVDVGPGGFTSTRVGVAFAKSLAWALDVKVLPLSSFDLIDRDSTVVVPSKKGEWIVRSPGQACEVLVGDRPAGSGYGPGVIREAFPDAGGCAPLLDLTGAVEAVDVNPFYSGEPSISIPKKARVLPDGGV